jgi:hypothetical protein
MWAPSSALNILHLSYKFKKKVKLKPDELNTDFNKF